MELVFVQSPSGWECEVEVTAEFNLHIERGGVGRLLLYQKTPGGGKYDRVRDFNVGNGDMVIDYDSGSFIAPKTIKIESSVEPTYAALTTSGEVTEIKAQSKVVEVTSNGTTAVTPDAGFAYVSNVEVKTNVATEGGGSGSIEYYDISGEDFRALAELAIVSQVVKQKLDDGTYMIAPTMMALISGNSVDINLLAKVVAFGVIPTQKILGGVLGDGMKISELYGQELWDTMPKMTESEFYNIDTPNTPA